MDGQCSNDHHEPRQTGRVYKTEEGDIVHCSLCSLAPAGREETTCFLPLTCEKKIVQTSVPGADPCSVSLQLLCVETWTTPIYAFHTDLHLHTKSPAEEMCRVSVREGGKDKELLSLLSVSVVIKQQLRHID